LLLLLLHRLLPRGGLVLLLMWLVLVVVEMRLLLLLRWHELPVAEIRGPRRARVVVAGRSLVVVMRRVIHRLLLVRSHPLAPPLRHEHAFNQQIPQPCA
jgi:hypothetical protein